MTTTPSLSATAPCRRWVATLLAAIVAFTGDLAADASAPTYLSNRAPAVTGTVVDYSHDWTGPGLVLEPGLQIANEGGAIRKTVLEFDVADLVPGVMETARIAGTITPLSTTPVGERSINFTVNAGDGVLGLDDSYQSGSYSAGWFLHGSSVARSYDIDITSQLRQYMLQDPDYFKLLIEPGAKPQGPDTVVDPLLKLQLRPTTAATSVYYQKPAATAAATAQNGGAFSVNPSLSSAPVMNWTYPPFEQGRGLMEFDLSSIPAGAIVQWAKLDLFVNGLQSGGPNLQIVGYHGDGVATASDLASPGLWTGASGELRDTGAYSWDVSTALVASAIHNGRHLGLRFQPGVSPESRARIVLNLPSSPGWEPRLAIAYVVPEPSTLAIVAIVTPLLALQLPRMKRSRSQILQERR